METDAYRDAIQILNEVITLSPQYYKAYETLGVLHIESTDSRFVNYELALEYLSDASKIKPDKKLIAISMNEKCIPRKGYKIYNKNNEIGYITSGTFSPTINKGIALGYVNALDFDSENIFVNIRNKQLPADFIKGSFIEGNSLFE